MSYTRYQDVVVYTEGAPPSGSRALPLAMTIPNNSSAKSVTVQIPTSSGDAIEAWV